VKERFVDISRRARDLTDLRRGRDRIASEIDQVRRYCDTAAATDRVAQIERALAVIDVVIGMIDRSVLVPASGARYH
jgi:hypothetical protein